MFITVKIKEQSVKALFDPSSCSTYLGGPALDKFPGMLRQAKKGTKVKVLYLNGKVEETGGTTLVCMGIDSLNKKIGARAVPSFKYITVGNCAHGACHRY